VSAQPAVTRRKPTVIGLGNSYAHDDGVGPAVTAALAAVTPAGVTIVELDGEPARLIEAWAGTPLTIVVDAARSGAAPGTVVRLEGEDLADGLVLGVPGRRSSSHALGVVEALGLGQAMARLPARLVVFAVEGQDFTPGPGLSDVVRGAVPQVVSAIVSELTSPDARRVEVSGAVSGPPSPRGRRPGSLRQPGAGRR
jgi:hydrogenase maturation protease